MSSILREIAFESVIEADLLASGYVSLKSKDFDKKLAIFPSVALDFIRNSQPKEWQKLENLLGSNINKQILSDLCKWMDTYGSLATLRHGFKCYGRTIQVAFFKPAHGLNAEIKKQYAANQVGITRQLNYSEKNNNSIDITLSINGIPIITLELKNPMSGQTVEDAITQYRKDRDPREPIFEFKRRTLVHFAVDTENVSMTTRLAGSATQFLPFNKGLNGGAGNPIDLQGRNYRTAYLWEEVLEHDSLMDLLARFLHVEIKHVRNDEGQRSKREEMIFPRYHQLEAIRKLVEAAKTDGVGHNYLIEHSAGSGKSNTIGWLTHRLSSLHDDKDQRIFDSVIVVTDRTVLDQQLQDTIYQFEHRQGVVQKIDEDSRQLAEALDSAVPIIITTLQKFPFVTKHLQKMAKERGEPGGGVLPTRRCAVIIDEAHSSQAGETTTKLKGVLGGEELVKKAQEQAKEEGEENIEKLFRQMAERSQQANLSLFAFTATPKYKTMEIFNETFHLYTMRQAIEEGFIMDVLKNYTTYKTYYKLLRKSEKDLNVERRKAAKSLARFVRLHPHNLIQKAEVMLEHFYSVTRHKMGGRAKAMVVASSRLEAVRYKQNFDRNIIIKDYPIKTLVAFSGVVEDDVVPGKTYTEEAMNKGIKEKELLEAFATPLYQVLLVAEKYQTGFDQPLLHTMYVDRKLGGLQAVQTLSRINRTHPLKEDTFVLDFVNERKEIQEAFAQYYQGAEMGEEVEPSKMYQIKAELDQANIYLKEEVQRFAAIYYKPTQRQTALDHRSMNATLDPAVDRFRNWQKTDEGASDLWRSKISAFRNLYVFLSQIIPYQDSDLEKLYTFLRYLVAKLPRRKSQQAYQFNEEVQLQYYRLQKISEGSISLIDHKGHPLDGPTSLGSGIVREDSITFSRLIDQVNERFGTNFNEADQLFFDQIVETAIEKEDLQKAAKVNPQDKFALFFSTMLEDLIVERMDQNVDIFVRFMNDSNFQKTVSNWLTAKVYEKLLEDDKK